MANHEIKDTKRESRVIQSRILIAFIGVLALSAILIARLYFLQIIGHTHYETLSNNNRIDLVPVPPVRGLIFDRNGEVLAQNFPVYTLEVIPDQVEDMQRTLDEIGQLVVLTPHDLALFKKSLRQRPGFERRHLKTELSPDEASRFAVNQYRFKGVKLIARLQRFYPYGNLTAHVLGYVARIGPRDLARVDAAAYKGTDYIGKLGIEAYYENELHGQVGFEQAETNAHGRVVRRLNRTPAVAGVNLHLNLDIKLQEVATRVLDGRRGSIVAIEPATGGVLAFVSQPSFDANSFVNGIDTRRFRELNESEDRPLLNRALHGRYAPGSTIKGFIALAGLQAGIDPAQTISCYGSFSLPNSRHRYRDWKKEGHGHVDLKSAIMQSCDVYFYRLASKIGIRQIHDTLLPFGLGRKTGIDLNQEPSGLVPSPEWKRRSRNQPWYPGETVIAGIGQGYMLVTPLQLAVATATLANRGLYIEPRLLHSVEDPQTRIIEPVENAGSSYIEMKDSAYYDRVIAGMEAVVHGPRGTARRIGAKSSYRFAGKTGTAQVIGIAQNEEYDEENTAERFRDHSLFIAFAPVEKPRIAIAVVVENGGSGSRTAAPLAKEVLDYYLIDRLRRADLDDEESIGIGSTDTTPGSVLRGGDQQIPYNDSQKSGDTHTVPHWDLKHAG
ncbi:MAG: penicillin-binding protein 2 [marine bacterium B5-7]|nr:MAG: penicillin-binding protein 2 [marine bacterium B5-7]